MQKKTLHKVWDWWTLLNIVQYVGAFSYSTISERAKQGKKFLCIRYITVFVSLHMF
jgi:hypothetical protein